MFVHLMLKRMRKRTNICVVSMRFSTVGLGPTFLYLMDTTAIVGGNQPPKGMVTVKWPGLKDPGKKAMAKLW